MADPLSLLRKYNVEKKAIIQEDGQVTFGDFTWSKKAKTSYAKYGFDKDAPLEYYTLESLLYLLENQNLPHSAYVRQCAIADIPSVNRPDRRELLEYLNGVKTTSASIDTNVLIEVPKQAKRLTDTHESGEEFLAKKAHFEEAQVQRAREQLAARWDVNKKEASVNIESIKSLSETMSVEKIAAIKAKRLANKRSTIKSIDDDDARGADMRAILEFDEDSTKRIISRERVYRTPESILQSNGKNFAKIVFPILRSIDARERNRKRPVRTVRPPSPIKLPERGPIKKPTPKPKQYDRYDQEKFSRPKNVTEGFKIDTTGTYHGVSLKSLTEENPIDTNENTIQTNENPIQANEMPMQSNENPMQTSKNSMQTNGIPIQTNENAMQTNGNAMQTNETAMKTNGVPIQTNGNPIQTNGNPVQTNEIMPPPAIPPIVRPNVLAPKVQVGLSPKNTQTHVSRTPIIIIPSINKSLITMYNVKDILQDLKFVSTEEKRRQGCPRENEVLLMRKKKNMTVPYRIIENPQKLSALDWQRVVAVFVLGPAWQFKGWPWKSDPVEIFSKICAFHLCFREQTLNANVAKWAVTVLNISEYNRYMDHAVLKTFWDTLDKYMARCKPHLKY